VIETGRRLQQKSEALATRLPPLLVAAYRVADSMMLGLHGRRRPGRGETFWQFRRYQPTDSASLIDWRQSAKSQHVYVREQEWETSQNIWMWCDQSQSMDFRSSAKLDTKEECSRLLLLALSVLLLRGGERVGLLGSNGRIFKGIGALPRMVEVLTSNFGQPHLGGLPERRKVSRGSQVVFISDFLEPLSLLEERIKWYSGQGQRGLLLQVLDPAEMTLPYSGRARFRGLEGEEETVIGQVEKVRADYEKRMLHHIDGLTEMAHRLGWSFVSHKMDKPPQTALLALYLALSQEVD
jgi:uncharacterized protein (DUF58 family)